MDYRIIEGGTGRILVRMRHPDPGVWVVEKSFVEMLETVMNGTDIILYWVNGTTPYILRLIDAGPTMIRFHHPVLGIFNIYPDGSVDEVKL